MSSSSCPKLQEAWNKKQKKVEREQREDEEHEALVKQQRKGAAKRSTNININQLNCSNFNASGNGNGNGNGNSNTTTMTRKRAAAAVEEDSDDSDYEEDIINNPKEAAKAARMEARDDDSGADTPDSDDGEDFDVDHLLEGDEAMRIVVLSITSSIFLKISR